MYCKIVLYSGRDAKHFKKNCFLIQIQRSETLVLWIITNDEKRTNIHRTSKQIISLPLIITDNIVRWIFSTRSSTSLPVAATNTMQIMGRVGKSVKTPTLVNGWLWENGLGYNTNRSRIEEPEAARMIYVVFSFYPSLPLAAPRISVTQELYVSQGVHRNE